MIYDPTYNFLFLKNGRAASTEVEIIIQQHLSPSALYTANDRVTRDGAFPSKNNHASFTAPSGIKWKPDIVAHATFSEISQVLDLPAATKVLTTFRHPYDRVLSWYNWECEVWSYHGTLSEFIFERWELWENNSLFRNLPWNKLKILPFPILAGAVEDALKSFGFNPVGEVVLPEQLHQTTKKFATKADLTPEQKHWIFQHCKLESEYYGLTAK